MAVDGQAGQGARGVLFLARTPAPTRPRAALPPPHAVRRPAWRASFSPPPAYTVYCNCTVCVPGGARPARPGSRDPGERRAPPAWTSAPPFEEPVPSSLVLSSLLSAKLASPVAQRMLYDTRCAPNTARPLPMPSLAPSDPFLAPSRSFARGPSPALVRVRAHPRPPPDAARAPKRVRRVPGSPPGPLGGPSSPGAPWERGECRGTVPPARLPVFRTYGARRTSVVGHACAHVARAAFAPSPLRPLDLLCPPCLRATPLSLGPCASRTRRRGHLRIAKPHLGRAHARPYAKVEGAPPRGRSLFCICICMRRAFPTPVSPQRDVVRAAS